MNTVKSTGGMATLRRAKEPRNEGLQARSGAVYVNVVYWLRKLGERRRQLAWWSVRKRIVRDLVGERQPDRTEFQATLPASVPRGRLSRATRATWCRVWRR